AREKAHGPSRDSYEARTPHFPCFGRETKERLLRQHTCFPRGEAGAERLLDLAHLVSHVALADARGERVAQARVRGDVALAFEERARERGHDLRRRAAERDRATQWSNRLARAIVQEERLPETPEQLRRGEALLRVLNADTKDLLGLLDVAE